MNTIFRQPNSSSWCMCMLTILLTAVFSLIAVPVVSQEYTELPLSTIIVGGDKDFAPYQFLDERGRPAGINVDIMRAIGEIMHIGVSFQLTSREAAIEAFKAGRIQTLALFPSEELSGFADFTDSHASVYNILFVRHGDVQFNSIDEVRDREIIIPKDSPAREKFLSNRYGAKLITVPTELDAVRLLDSGMHDSAFISHLGGYYLRNIYDLQNIDKGSRPLLPSEYCFAVARGDTALLEILNKGLRILVSSGKYQEIYNEWLLKTMPEQLSFWDIIVRAKWFLIPLALTLVLALGWSWMLRREVTVRTGELVRVNRSLKTLSECNQAIVKSENESELLNAMCRIMVHEGNFRIACIGIMDDEACETMREVARSGGNTVFLSRLLESEKELPPKYKLCSQVVQTGKPTIIQNMLCGDVSASLRDLAIEHKLASAIALPLRNGGSMLGCFFIFASDINPFDKTEVALLTELYEDISFGINSLRTRIEHDRAVKEIEGLAKFPSENPNPVIRITYDNVIIYANNVALELLAKFNAKPGTKAPVFLIGKIKSIVESGKTTTIDLKWVDQTYTFHVAPFFKEGYINLYGQNITELIHLEAQLRQSQKMEAIGQLAGGIAHDFNNILTVIIGYAETAIDTLKDNATMLRLLQEIYNAGERAAALTRQLLAFSRKQVLQPEVFNLNMAITGMQDMLERLIGEDIDLVTVLADDLGNVVVDPGQTEQVIMNLVINARDAMPTGGKLIIETCNMLIEEEYSQLYPSVKPGRYVMMTVSDTGIGMSEEIRQHIFEPFFTTKDKNQGTGLGLATSYGIVRQSGGQIWVYSEVNEGTTFKVYLPRVDGAEQTRRLPINREQLQGSETILIVEDEDAVRTLVRHILEKRGFTILTAANADEAETVCREFGKPIDLVVTDVVMPGTSGQIMAERLRKTYPGIAVLYMSGYTDKAIVHHGNLAPGTNFIGKPFTSMELVGKVRNVLDENTSG